jgi:Fur family ferric uptake transcriptional regulator
MAACKNYKTKQRDVILAAMQRLRGEHISAEDLAALLRSRGDDVGLATVYRNLDKLVGEGVVLKYTLTGGGAACYQYMPEDGEENAHCHLVCTVCGEVQHLHCTEVEDLAQHLAAGHNFALDRQRTVLYGRCAVCSGQQSDAAGQTSCACHHS